MNKRIIVLSSVAIALTLILVLKNSDTSEESINGNISSNLKNQNIIFETEKKSKIFEEEDKLANKDTPIIQQDLDYSQNQFKNKSNSNPTYVKTIVPEIKHHSTSIESYIKSKSLKNITSTKVQLDNPSYTSPRFSVYSNITTTKAKQKRDNSLPPSAPVIVQGTFYSGTPYTVIIDGDLQREATDIVISNNLPDGSIEEIVNISHPITPDEEQVISFPPAIK